MVRPLALTMPAFALFSSRTERDRQHPPADAQVMESPSFTVGRSLAGILMTATAALGVDADHLAVYSCYPSAAP